MKFICKCGSNRVEVDGQNHFKCNACGQCYAFAEGKGIIALPRKKKVEPKPAKKAPAKKTTKKAKN